MIHYLLPIKIKPEFKPFLKECQWGEFIERGEQPKRFLIKSSKIATALRGQCATSFMKHELGVSTPNTTLLGDCW